ncbi:MAG TPA: hypothetical protein PKW55_02930 [Spirochaetota bacterium]|nr:hypothetical protein [Spirochaetota bacterium]
MKFINFILFLLLLNTFSFSFKGFVIGGEVRKKDFTIDKFILIEEKDFKILDKDEIKTLNNGNFVVYDEQTYFVIKPFSKINISFNDIFLEYGFLLIENSSDNVKRIKTNFFEFYFSKGIFLINVKEDGFYEIVSIKGTSRIVSSGGSYILNNYQRLIYNKESISYSYLPIEEVDYYKKEYGYFLYSKSLLESSIEERKKFWNIFFGFGVSLLSGEYKDYLILSPKVGFRYKGFNLRLILPVYVDYKDKSFYKPDTFGNKDEWDFESFSDSLSDLILKIDSISYKYNGIYIESGNIDKIDIGNNTVLDYFRPNINYPQNRVLSLKSTISFYNWGLMSFVSDLSSCEIFGIRGYYNPFRGNIFLDKTEIGLTFVSDLDPNDLKKSKAKDKLFAFGMDFNFPIYNLWEKVTFNFYIETSKIFVYNNSFSDVNGFAMSYGVKGNIFYYFHYRLGGIILKDDYPDSYFDSMYILSRKSKFYNLLTKSENNKYGIFFGLSFDKISVIKFDISYRETLSEKIIENVYDNKFSFDLFLYPEVLDFMYFNIGYYRVGIDGFSEFFKNIFSDDRTSINIGLILPFKLEYLY